MNMVQEQLLLPSKTYARQVLSSLTDEQVIEIHPEAHLIKIATKGADVMLAYDLGEEVSTSNLIDFALDGVPDVFVIPEEGSKKAKKLHIKPMSGTASTILVVQK